MFRIDEITPIPISLTGSYTTVSHVKPHYSKPLNSAYPPENGDAYAHAKIVEDGT